MELTAQEIKKISKGFKIPEKALIDFLAEEDRIMEISFAKEAVIKNSPDFDPQKVKQWLDLCQNFSEFEDFYIIAENQVPVEEFFLNWMKACTYYKERREVLSYAPDNKTLRKKLIETWVTDAINDAEIREAISHTDKGDEIYSLGIKKIYKLYKE